MPAAPHVAAASLQGGMVQRSVAPVRMGPPSGGAIELPPGFLDTSRGGPGQPLPAPLRERMESALGADFSSVRVHQGPQAAAIGALAFTSGSDLYFAPGQYDPGSLHGQRLIAHELTHVVQQRAGRVRNPLGHGVAVVQDHALEAEAERMARGVAQLRPAPAAVARTARPAAARGRGVIQRLSYRSSKTRTVFRITFSTSDDLKFTATDNSGNSAYLKFEYWDRLGPATALVLSFYGKNMKTSGTRVGYLLFYLFGLKAQKDGKTNAQLATAVFKDEGGHIYNEIGFDTTSAETLSKSVVPISQVISNAQAKLSGYWDPADDEEVSVVSVNTPLLETQQSSSCCWPFNKCCFLTSACTAARGLPDDCEELTVLRGFRDGYLSETAERRDLVARYYEIAPPIVTAIEESGRAGEEYEAIYGIVATCAELIRNGRNEEAMRRYRSMVEDLESRHLMLV